MFFFFASQTASKQCFHCLKRWCTFFKETWNLYMFCIYLFLNKTVSNRHKTNSMHLSYIQLQPLTRPFNLKKRLNDEEMRKSTNRGKGSKERLNGFVKRSIKPTQSSGHGGRHIRMMFFSVEYTELFNILPYCSLSSLRHITRRSISIAFAVQLWFL